MSASQVRTTIMDAENVKQPAVDRPAAASLKRQAFLDIIYRTAALVVFALIVAGFLRSTIFFIPCLAAAACLYVAAVAQIVLAGMISGPLYSSLRTFALTVFCTTLIMAPGLPSAANGLGPAIFLLGLIWSVHFTSKAYAEITRVATRSLLIAAIGYLYYSLFSSSGLNLLPQLGLVVLTGFVGTAAFTFLSILKGHSNARLAAAGKAFSGLWSPVTAGTAVAIITTYLVFVRSSLLALGPLWITVAEVAAMCVAIYILFREIRFLLPRDGMPSFGDGHTVAGKICYEKGELDKAAAAVGEFVATGKKDGLATLTMAALLKNNLPPEAVQKVVSIVIDYNEEPEPPVLLKWAVGDMDEARRKKRMAAVNEMMAAAADACAANGHAAGAGD
ncbi:MAG TPA: hypothetical protein VGJ92_05070 [Methanocella sp.]